MKSVIFSLILLAGSNFIMAQQAEKELIQTVIQTAYVEGIHNRAGIEKITAGFHPGFEMIGTRNGLLTKFPIYSWIESIQQAMANARTNANEAVVTAKFPLIDVSGDAAVAKVELFREGKQLFTDYLLLYKLDKGWRIVSKIYYRLPE
ncbi:MAG: nuclear transport factor 2 family protein [Bacteroidetes bacterium]|nr:nuclear transport factor 2 family protein [Bacteroidota bacterium]MBU1580652.1 nuclear transport factor 2 family protein [Bacteroidota bacterium]MBU2465663.1 nuclear transport factor 2 family protein [Bacteroidota bacterium]MBU2557166.1 nuclear transport factor 2 family protein [Bacteroidota bacterium]